MFDRILRKILEERAQKIPVVAVLGPRQSGKTTLVREVFKNHVYVSLETFEDRELAEADPRAFFEKYTSEYGIILDEVQRVPTLLSYVQLLVDAKYRPGYFVITGSQNIMLNQAISQTLAGRITLLTLLPFSIPELRENKLLADSVEQTVWRGCYPRVYDQNLDSVSWYLDYIETYVERDARMLVNVSHLNTFRKFIRLCAGRTGQILNMVSLATDCGIDQRTAKAWLSVLEASYIIFLLQPHHENFNKRLIKSPKIYFYDAGLVCSLLSIKSVSQLNDHYLRGSIIETFLVSDIIKHYYNNGLRPNDVYFWRDSTGNEVDCVITKDGKLVPIEIKASKTVAPDFFKGLQFFSGLKSARAKTALGYVLYCGPGGQKREQATVVAWRDIEDIFS